MSQPWLDEAVGTARWTGTPLASLLDEAGVADGAVDVVFTGADHGVERGVEQDYQRALPIAEARRPDVLLAHAMNGEPLPPQHGAPLRLIVPGWYGMAHVKWLVDITVLDEPFTGYQNATTYRIKKDADDAGEPVTRILPRALLRRPASPTSRRGRGSSTAACPRDHGRAWSGVRADRPASRSATTAGRPGTTPTLGARRRPVRLAPVALDVEGRRARAPTSCAPGPPTQPARRSRSSSPGTVQAMANNHVQRVAVFVR